MSTKPTTVVTLAPRPRGAPRADAPTALDLDLPDPQGELEDAEFLRELVCLLGGFEAARGRFGRPADSAALSSAVSSAADWVVRLADAVRALSPHCHPAAALAAADAFVLDAGKLMPKGGRWRSLFGGRPAVDQSGCLLLLHELPAHLGRLLDALGGGFRRPHFRAQWENTVVAFTADIRAELAWLARPARKPVLG